MRVLKTSVLTLTVLMLTAPVAFAEHDGGEGWYGETNDRVITNAGFLMIAAFPLVALIGSIAYEILERRRLERVKAAKVRAARADQRGGW